MKITLPVSVILAIMGGAFAAPAEINCLILKKHRAPRPLFLMSTSPRSTNVTGQAFALSRRRANQSSQRVDCESACSDRRTLRRMLQGSRDGGQNGIHFAPENRRFAVSQQTTSGPNSDIAGVLRYFLISAATLSARRKRPPEKFTPAAPPPALFTGWLVCAAKLTCLFPNVSHFFLGHETRELNVMQRTAFHYDATHCRRRIGVGHVDNS